MTDQTGSSGSLGLERQVEADELVVLLDELERLGAEPTSLGDAVQLIVETSQSRLVKISGRMKSLNFGASLRAADAARGIPNPRLERLCR